MRKWAISTVLALLAALIAAGDTEAQLFGQRSVGGSVTRRARPGASGSGTVTGNERFIRGNRERGSFVGADLEDIEDFVGLQQGSSITPRSTSRVVLPPLRIESAPDANRVVQRSPATGHQATVGRGMYSPRLSVGFDHPTPRAERINTSLGSQLEALLTRRLRPTAPGPQQISIEVSLEGETARLQGVVFSEHARYLAELLVLFEPGISAVKNDLIVAAPDSAEPNSLPQSQPRQGVPQPPPVAKPSSAKSSHPLE